MKAQVTYLFHKIKIQHLIFTTLVWFSHVTSQIWDLFFSLENEDPIFLFKGEFL